MLFELANKFLFQAAAGDKTGLLSHLIALLHFFNVASRFHLKVGKFDENQDIQIVTPEMTPLATTPSTADAIMQSLQKASLLLQQFIELI